MRSGPDGTAWPAPRELAERAARVLIAELEEVPTGTNWPFVSPRFLTGADPGLPRRCPTSLTALAGIAAALALAGAELDRPDLTAAALRGAEHLVSLGDAER